MLNVMPRLTGLALGLTTIAAALGTAPAASAMPDGGYIALGLGGAAVSGERGVGLTMDGAAGALLGQLQNTPGYDEVVRTDAGSGMFFNLRFGYLIDGLIAPELDLAGHGTFDAKNGAAYASFILRYHPVAHGIPLAERDWDVDLSVGIGYTIAGYAPDERIDDNSKGWEGFAIHAGIGFAYQVADSVSLGVDVRVLLPRYTTFIIDWDDDVRAEPREVPSTVIVAPTAQVIFHL